MYAWKSPLVLILLTLGCTFFIVFVIYEAKFARIPIMPSIQSSKLSLTEVHLFTIKSVALILVQTFFVGIVYYSNLYYLPVFSQVLQRRSIIASGVILLPLIITQTFTATLAGFILAKFPSSMECADWRTGRYNPCICGGFAMWTLGLGLQTTFSPNLSLGKIIGYLIVEGFGIGLTFQTSMLSANQLNSSTSCSTSNIA